MKPFLLIGIIVFLLSACTQNSSTEKLYSDALKHYKNKEFLHALETLDKTTLADPDYYKAYLLKAKIFRKRHDFEQASANTDKYLSYEKEMSPGYTEKARIKYELSDYYGAISDCNKALEHNNENALAYKTRAKGKARIGDEQGAISDYTSAIKYNEGDGESYLRRGDVYTYKKNARLACSDYEKAGDLGYLAAYKRLRERCDKKADTIVKTETIIVKEKVEVEVEASPVIAETKTVPVADVKSVKKKQNDFEKYAHLKGNIYQIRGLIKNDRIEKGQKVEYAELGFIEDAYTSIKAIDENNYFVQFYVDGELARYGTYRYKGKDESQIVYRRVDVSFDEEIRVNSPATMGALVKSQQRNSRAIIELRNYTKAFGFKIGL